MQTGCTWWTTDMSENSKTSLSSNKNREYFCLTVLCTTLVSDVSIPIALPTAAGPSAATLSASLLPSPAGETKTMNIIIHVWNHMKKIRAYLYKLTQHTTYSNTLPSSFSSSSTCADSSVGLGIPRDVSAFSITFVRPWPGWTGKTSSVKMTTS